MGQTTSKDPTRSPSAAFGRLRIDSPGTGKIVARRLRKQQQHVQKSLPKTRSLNGLYQPTEASPLIQSRLLLESSSDMGHIKVPPGWWVAPALVCALCYALYNIFIKKGSSSIHPILGGVILQLVAAIFGSVLLIGLIAKDGHSDIAWDPSGIYWSVLAGMAVGAAEILSFCVSGMGVQATQSIPIIIGGSVVFGTTLGFVYLHEMLTMSGWMGVALIAFGIGLVGIDPGAAALH